MPEFRQVPDHFAAAGALRLGSAGGILWWLSYSVPVGIAVVVLAVAMATFGPGGTADLPGSAAMATAFWISGWMVQLTAYLGLCWVLGASTTSMRIGLLGVEALPRIWNPARAMLVAVGTILPLLLLGMFYRWVEGGFQVPQVVPAGESVWTPPSVGFKSHESIWLTGAWLCWVQAIVQMVPFPRTPGRQLIASLVCWIAASHSEPIQRRLFQKVIVALSIAIVATTIPMMSSDNPNLQSSWPWVLIGGVLLWVSSRSSDVIPLIGGMQGEFEDGGGQSPAWYIRIRHRFQQWRNHRRLQRAMVRERVEASDAKRVDEILNRLHHDGPESLSSEDRKLLDRVSESLRRERNGNRPTE